MSAAFGVFRSCTTSLSSGALARNALRVQGRRIPGALRTRHYSVGSGKGSTGGENPADAPSVEGTQAGGAKADSAGQEGDASKANSKSDESPDAEKLKAKENEVVDLTSRLRYLQADFLNLQRNTAREKEQMKDFAITRFASDLLETVDVLAMALNSIPKSILTPSSSTSPDSLAPPPPPPTPAAEDPPPKTAQQYLQELHTGVDMTHRLLLQTLFKYHVKPFDPTGDKFDPNRHEALYQAPVPGKEPGTVISCQKTGYTIKERVLRAAQVGVVQDTS